MHAHQTLLARFFDALAAHDAQAAARCYHPEIFLTSPLYPRLRGAEACDFWRMAFEDAPGLALELHGMAADDDGGHASWTWSYNAAPARRVRIRGRSLFAFREGLVCRHYDHFSYWRWLAATLGPAGASLGWFGPFRWAVRQRLARRLERYRFAAASSAANS